MKVNFKDIFLINKNEGYKPTTKSILLRITDEDIFRKYAGHDFKIGKVFRSPFREDKNPSFNIFQEKKTKKVFYKDFGDGTSGDCFSFVQRMYSIGFIEALKLIDRDFCLKMSNTTINIRRSIRKHLNSQGNDSNNSTIINIIKQPYTFIDFRYWGQYGIDFKLLKRYNVHSCKEVYLNKKRVFKYSKNNPIYAYQFKNKYKIYCPLSTNGFKWISNVTGDILQGKEQLLVGGKLLIITKSMKDVLTLVMLGYDAIAPQSEGTRIDKKVIRSFKQRFNDTVVLYDEDKVGIKAANDIKEEHNIDHIFLPKSLMCKDISEVVKIHGQDIAKDFLIYNLY